MIRAIDRTAEWTLATMVLMRVANDLVRYAISRRALKHPALSVDHATWLARL